MGTFSGTYTFDMTVLANYKALMGDIHAQIQAMGWVQTSDTGQTDPGGVGSLPTTDTYGNYDVYRMNDGLTNVYLKVGYGRTQSGSWPSFQVKIGTSTDGAGTLSGNVSSTKTFHASTNASSLSVYVSGDTNRIGVSLNPSSSDTNQQCMFAVERSLDSSGAATATHATIWWQGYNAVTGQHTINLSGTNGVEQTLWRAAAPRPASSGSTWTVSGNIGVAFSVPMPATYASNPSLQIGMCGASDGFTPGTTTVITHYGASHTYLVANRVIDDNSFARPLMRYE